MSAPDYVAQAAELLREHHIVPDGIRCNCGWLIRQGADGGPSAGAHAAHLAEVLAAAGLLPTSTEWGVRFVGDTTIETHADEADARLAATGIDSDGLVSRAVTDWKDASDD